MKKVFFFLISLFLLNLSNGQGFDSIYVEKIPVSLKAIADDINLNSNSIAYRVFISMKPGYLLATVDGGFANPLLIKTSTQFYNNEDGEIIPLYRPIPTMDDPLYYDSWITIGQYGKQSASSQLVPLTEDTSDGVQDGIVSGAVTNATALDPATNFMKIWGYEMGPSAEYGTTGYDPENVIWYAAGGVSGIGPSNSVCIGQFTTDGDFSMELRFQIIPPTGPTEVYVVREKIQTNDRISDKIIYPPNVRPSVQITSPANGSVYKIGETVNFTANAEDEDGGIAEVTFFVGSNQNGTYTTPPYATTFEITQKGSLNLYAVVRDNRYGRDTSEIITIYANQPPTVNIVSPLNGATYNLGDQVPLEANASSADGNVTKVEFYADDVLVATINSPGPYSIDWLPSEAGVKKIMAKVYDDLNGIASSNIISITVNAPGNTPPVVSITSPQSGDVFTVGESITLTADASDPDPGDQIIKVEFFSNGTIIGEDVTAPFELPWLSNIGGSKVITAVATDNRGGKSTSSEITIIHNILPYVVITSPANGETFIAGSPLTILATATDQNGSILKVELMINDVSAGDFSLVSGNNFTFTWSGQTGQNTLKAIATDNHNGQYISESVSITVNSNVGTGELSLFHSRPILVYPNPASDVVTIYFQNVMTGGRTKCEVIDALGKKMLSVDIYTEQEEKTATINISQLPSGIYFIKLSHFDGSLIGTSRIIKK